MMFGLGYIVWGEVGRGVRNKVCIEPSCAYVVICDDNCIYSCAANEHMNCITLSLKC